MAVKTSSQGGRWFSNAERAVRLGLRASCGLSLRDGHISRSDEYDDYIEWFIDRGISARNALNTYRNAR